MITDPISDFLTRIRNAQRAGHPGTLMPLSKLKMSLADVLVSEGFISGFESVNDGKFEQIKVFLKYQKDGKPVIRRIKRVSKPGRRIYLNKDDLKKLESISKVRVLSTSKGVMTDKNASNLGVGGEILCEIE